MASEHPAAWSDGDIQREQDSPIPPYSTCIASRSFRGKEAHDLPFVKGEVLTVIEPCNVVFWYLAENRDGKRGIIPITHVKVQSFIPQAHRQSSHTPAIPPKAMEYREQASSPLHASHSPASTNPPPPSHTPPTIPPPPLHPKPSSRSPSHQHTSTPPPTAPKPLLPPKPKRVSKSLPRQLQQAHPQQLARRTSTESPTPHPSHGDTPPMPHPLHGEGPLASHSPSTKAAPPIPFERSSLVDIDSRPPAPLPQEATQKRQEPVTIHRPGKYRTKDEFINKSGWFAPTVDNCLIQKTNMQMPAFRAVKHGIFYFQHKREQKLKYVGRSHHVYEALITMYHRLFELPDRSLSPLEVELKYYHPDASEWIVRVQPCRQPEDLDLEETKFIMMHRTLVPEGLNRELVFQSREHFYAFAEWYSGFRRSSMRSLFYPQAAGKNRKRSATKSKQTN